MGNAVIETLRANGTIKKQRHFILIDMSSTHSFIQERIVKLLGLHVAQSPCVLTYGG